MLLSYGTGKQTPLVLVLPEQPNAPDAAVEPKINDR